MSASQPPSALTIAGLDPSGCYGLSADVRTFLALGVHAASVVTILTAQNTAGLRGAQPVAADFVRAQAEAVLDDLVVGATKVGMLASVAIIEAVAAVQDAGRMPNLVVDPVLVGSNGRPLFDASVIDAYRRLLAPKAVLLTPNIAEASLLLGRPLTDPQSVADAAAQLGRTFATNVVITTGAARSWPAHDAWFDPLDDSVRWLEGNRIATTNVAGSGDSFSAAVTALVARGAWLPDALRGAKDFVEAALAGGAKWVLGAGSGPLDHFGWSRPRH